MTRTLDSKRRDSASGRTGSVMVFLHGYGADGADLLGLADPLAPHLPDTVFVAPDAPERSTVNPMGFQWFPIPWLDGSDPAAAESAMDAAVADLNAYLDDLMVDEGIEADQLVLMGFSQGTMMALHVALRREYPVAALVGFSGRLLRPESLEAELRSKPPVLLIHGDQDDVVPPASLPEAAQTLQDAGLDVYAHVMKGTGHGIAPDGLSVALAFVRDRLGLDKA
ncbi:prolyl oligopeptidase family serine peptidase [Maribius pontilimi]|uniref:Prolyl oligopeptidase family serine peptidase n=1 Tax=Palleronia pontilimi TaxID=1964209 RepID=A0A934IK99_9RHOB|nr:alpha/beta fold hydrolase [Palleronia pontilimi]MBJ3763514.1 prolyl oligopeptidase family serine peptidase [Palleronia pontilimi]